MHIAIICSHNGAEPRLAMHLYLLYEKVWSSPYINRFLQPDTVIPDLSNPQGWNRFSYVTNRPVNFNDPTGHMMTQGDGGLSPSEEDYCDTHPEAEICGGDPDDELSSNGGGGSVNDETNNPLIDILDYYNYGLNETMDGCNPFDPNQISAFWNNAACLDVMSNLSQDMATLFSTTGASVTLALTLLACIPASEVGGCGVGYALGFLVYQTFFNPYETMFSGASTFMAIRSDFLTHDTYFNGLRDWQIGEDSKTSFGASLIGGLTAEPFIDAAIDVYSSGYNHGYFCGVSTILDCLVTTMP